MQRLSSAITKATLPYLFQYDFLLKELPAKDLDLLRLSAKPVKRKRGEILFHEGDTPTHVCWLFTGKVKISQETEAGRTQTLYIYSDGDLIAYRQLIAEEVHPVSAQLLEDSTIGFVPGNIFRKLLQDSHEFTNSMLAALARDFSVWTHRMTVFAQFPVRKRVLLALLILYEQYRLSGSTDGLITMTRTELAEYVGASLETVVRAMNGLKRQKLISVYGRSITLEEPLKLLKLFEQTD
jgi:CRP/FNR family transcriptional regulator